MKTLLEPITIESEVKKSKFISTLFPIKSEEHAKELLKEVKKQHPKANHHCSAYIVDQIVRSNDDGEPSGTAGMPMLQSLQGNELYNVLAVVVRYFGGTLLGKGGLIRAYSGAVTQAIEAATLYEPQSVYVHTIEVPFEMMNALENMEQINIVHRDYSAKALYTFETLEENILEQLVDITLGQLTAISSQTKERLVKIKEIKD